MILAQAFSIIIPTYNRSQRLADCLQGIAALEYPRELFQVIVVNDGGTAIPKELVHTYEKNFELAVVCQNNRGPSAARNNGVNHARFAWLVFLDDDCVPTPDWLTHYARAAQQFPNAVLGGETRNGLNENIFSEASQCLFAYLYAYYHQCSFKRRQLPYFTSNNLAVSQSAYHAVNGFDETMRYAEDRDICARLLETGYVLRYIPLARVLHYRELNFQSFLRQHQLYGEGAFHFHRKRTLAHGRNVRLEPPQFYFQMLRYPFQYTPRARRRVMLLVALSQMANALGFLRAKYFGA